MENPEHLRNKIDVFHQPEIKYTYIENYTLTKVKKRLRKYLQHIGQKKMLPKYCAKRESSIEDIHCHV